MNIKTINPATETLINEYQCLEKKEVDIKIEKGHEAFLQWKNTSSEQKKVVMLKLAGLLLEKKEVLSRLITTEMGKPVMLAEAEIEKCSLVCRHYAEYAEGYLSPRLIESELKKAKIGYEPIGLIFAIMPWNFPFWQVFRCAVPVVMAGNGMILKHAPITTGCGRAIEALFCQVGFPSGLFQQVIIGNEQAAQIIAHEKIAAVTLTGSERAGRSVASQAGQYLKKSVLELGGSDPYLVLEDADLDLAAGSIVSSRLNNSGQVCIAAKRVIAVNSILEALTAKIDQLMSGYKMGNPLDAGVQLGPLARKDLRDTLHNQVEKTIKLGAKLLRGGIIPSEKGFYYPPTLLTDVMPGMPAFDEELFGPVIPVIAARNEAEAIALANKTDFGLGAAVFTRDLERGERIATQALNVGTCYVNSLVVSDPALPFGGIKHSGFGRELSREGILEFVNTKTIVIMNEVRKRPKIHE